MVRMMSLSFFFLSILAIPKSLLSQNYREKIDSLLKILRHTKQDTSRVNLFNDLSNNYINSGNYLQAKSYADSALLLAEKINSGKGKAIAYRLIGITHGI